MNNKFMEGLDSRAHRILFLNTITFGYCFAVWLFNCVLVTFLSVNGIFNWSPSEMGWLMGIPILGGSILRIPVNILCDKYGGKWVFVGILLISAVPLYLLSHANSFLSYFIFSFGVGLTGTAFAVGSSFSLAWYPKKWHSTAMGTFGAGNAGAALTTLLLPGALSYLTKNGQNLEQWRMLPKYMAAGLVVMAIVMAVFSTNRKAQIVPRTFQDFIRPLGNIRVLRFSLYYFLSFGCFVAFAQWLVPYFMNVYGVSLMVAGSLAAIFSFPSGIIRALGGWMSDKWGARTVMFKVFVWSVVLSFLLIIPKMDLLAPGNSIYSKEAGKVAFVSDSLVDVQGRSYILTQPEKVAHGYYEKNYNLKSGKKFWHTPVVKTDQLVKKNQQLAYGTNKISVGTNLWIFLLLVTTIGIIWGIGKAAVFKFIPDYFPNDSAAVGGIVSVVGSLSGFVGPVVFGYLVEWTNMWTSAWLFILILSVVCYLWMKRAVKAVIRSHAPSIVEDIDIKHK